MFAGVIAGRAAELLDDAKATIALRTLHYGRPEESFRLTADLWSAWLSARLGVAAELEPVDVCMLLALLKTARLAHDPTHRDSALDAAAYAALTYGAVKPHPPRQHRTRRAEPAGGRRT